MTSRSDVSRRVRVSLDERDAQRLRERARERYSSPASAAKALLLWALDLLDVHEHSVDQAPTPPGLAGRREGT